MKKILAVVIAVTIPAVMGSGCATAVKKPVDTGAVNNTGEVKTEKYVVQKGDSLWKISGKTGIYGDPFMWPLLFKANRDQIEDPDLINVSQEIGVKKEFDGNEAADARQKAKDTPPYTEHAAPRQKLPLKY